VNEKSLALLAGSAWPCTGSSGWAGRNFLLLHSLNPGNTGAGESLPLSVSHDALPTGYPGGTEEKN